MDLIGAQFSNDQPGERVFQPTEALRKIITQKLTPEFAEPLLGGKARAVRIILFNKVTDLNWALGWHQDRVIAVESKHDIAGYTNWTLKHGAYHVEPPFSLLEKMITLRLNIDPSDAESGALEVIPLSHLRGMLDDTATQSLANEGNSLRIDCARGDALLLATPIVHRSRKTASRKSRRVLHIDYCAEQLPTPLKWALQL